MSVYHCPLCPLIFQHRSEVEWHLREEHRSRSDEAAAAQVELAAAVRPLDRERLAQLRASRGGPSVTLLLGTTPSSSMTVLDVARLRQLAERARRRLSSEPDRDTAVAVLEERLSTAVSAAESQTTDRGMAVLVNGHDLAIITLPFAPRDRQVVDGAFATRDLDYALRRYPRFRVLVLGHHPRVLEGHAGNLSEPATHPARRSPRALPSVEATDHHGPDTLLGERLHAAGRLPLVLVGDHRNLDRFRRRSRHAADVVAEVHRPRFPRTSVTELVAGTLRRMDHEQQSRAVAELLHADMQSQVAWGIEAAWRAVHGGVADRLWVEHDYAIPGRTTLDPYGVETGTEPAEPGAIDDLVDALISKAAQLGIDTHVLARHTLDRSEPVAVKLPVPARTLGAQPRSLVMT